MIESNRPVGGAKRASKTQFAVQTKLALGLVVVASVLALGPSRAEGQDEDYLRIYEIIQQADSLSTNKQADAALAKYWEAQMALRNLQRDYPNWNKNVVSFRLNYLAERVGALSDKNATRAPAAAATGTPKEKSETKPAAPASTLRVKLLDAGTEPRKALRLHPQPGAEQTLVITMKMAMEMKVGEIQSPAMKLPPITMTMNTTVKDVSADGDITYQMVIGDTSVSDDPGVMPQVAQIVKTALAGLKGMSGTGITSSRGLSKVADIKVPPGTPPQLSQVMDQMKEFFSRVSAPLPEEAVGPGARWEVKMPVKSQGMTIDQTASYQLISTEGERVTAKSSLTQNAANQKIQDPAMPGLKIDLTKMVGNGTGDVTLDLAQLLPSTGTFDFHTELDTGMNVGGQKQKMTTKMDMNLRFGMK
jgi:hypothetical protein